MKIPVIRGVIDRRILVNYRVEPGVLARMLPKPFQPKLCHGVGVAGICLIRLKQIRPRGVPGFLGISSENAAHRIAVEWTQEGQLCEGVYIPRRDTSLWLNTLAGGRLFPGVHHHAHFDITERADFYSVAVRSDDGCMRLKVDARRTALWPGGSIFNSLREASQFFEGGSVGYSTTPKPGEFDGLELRVQGWKVEPLAVEQLHSSFFEDPKLFPPGSARLDCALLMLGIEHQWCGKPKLCSCEAARMPRHAAASASA